MEVKLNGRPGEHRVRGALKVSQPFLVLKACYVKPMKIVNK